MVPSTLEIDDIDMLRKALGPHFPPFFKILGEAQGMKESKGFYSWKDPDGKIREKYMTVTPIKLEGKPFLLMSTEYIDEFTKKTETLKSKAAKLAEDTTKFLVIIGLAGIVLMALIIIFYGYTYSSTTHKHLYRKIRKI